MTTTPIHRIVLTGGPGAGKTVISSRLADSEPLRYVRVPEAATQVYEALRTRWDRLDVPARRDVQRRIYRLQVEQEVQLERAHPEQILLLDRGTVDGSAYWPDGPEDYWRDLHTTHQQELARYDAVIWMESSAALGLYDGDSSNAVRFEDAAQAVRNGDLLRQLWSQHPRLLCVPATSTVEEKLARVRSLIEAI